MSDNIDRRDFLRWLAAAATVPVIGCGSDEQEAPETPKEKDYDGVFRMMLKPREGSGLYTGGWIDKDAGLIVEQVHSIQQIGTASVDSIVLGLITTPTPVSKLPKNFGYSQFVVPGPSQLLSNPSTRKEVFGRTKQLGISRFYKVLVKGLDQSGENKYGFSHSDQFAGSVSVVDSNNFTAVLGGDLGQHYSPKQIWSNSEQVNEFISGMGADFAMPLGDFVSHDQLDKWFTQYLNLYTALQGMPVFPALGNHDLSNKGRGNMKKNMHVGFSNLFGANGKSLDGEVLISSNPGRPVNYSFDRGNMHFVVLDSCLNGRYNRGYSDSVRYLASDLKRQHKKNPNSVNVVLSHHPFPLTAGALLEDTPYKVHAMITGHTHEYGRHSDEQGIQYIRSGGMGAKLHTKRTGHRIYTRPKKYRKSLKEEVDTIHAHHVTTLQCKGNEVTMRAITCDGSLIDEVKLN